MSDLISREAVIKCLETYTNAMHYIKNLPSEVPSDLISRQVILNTLDSMDKALDENRTVEAYKELLKKCFKELPPVEPRTCTTCEHSDEVDGEHCYECVKGMKNNFEPQEWISVKDRLPTESGEYYITFQKKNGERYTTTENFYGINQYFKHKEYFKHLDVEIVAWQRKVKPSPYKGE